MESTHTGIAGQPRTASVQKAAQILDIPAGTVRSLLREKKLPGIKLGGAWRVDLQQLEALLARGAVAE